MKEHRQMYLIYFLAYCLFAALLLSPQLLAPHKIPSLFSSSGAVLIGTCIGGAIRARKANLPWSRLIPAAVIVLVGLAQSMAAIWRFSPATGHEAEIFLFYLVTTLVIIFASAVGFFLK